MTIYVIAILSGFAAVWLFHFTACYASVFRDIWRGKIWWHPPYYVRQVIKASRLRRVILMRAELGRGRNGGRMLGISFWLFGFNFILIDSWFSRLARPPQLEFLTAHECGHLMLGHSRDGFFRIASMFILDRTFDVAQREAEADTVAEHMTGYDRSVYDDLPRI